LVQWWLNKVGEVKEEVHPDDQITHPAVDHLDLVWGTTFPQTIFSELNHTPTHLMKGCAIRK